MIIDLQKFKPIKTFGMFLSFLGVVGIIIFLLEWNNPDFKIPFQVFLVAMIVWHLLTGIGIITRRTWGFHLMKFYLHLLMWGYPFGTITAKRMFKYVEENQIKDVFFSKGIPL